MKTEEAMLPALGGLAAGILGTLVLQPSCLNVAAWATSDPAAAGRAKGVLEKNGIPYQETQLTDRYGMDNTVRLSGPEIPAGGRILYILLVKQSDWANAGYLIQSSITK